MAKVKYKNAASGISKIFGAEILAIVATIVAGIGTAGAPADVTNMEGWRIAFIFISAVVAIIALIVALVGLHSASKDHRFFKHAFTFALLALVVSIIGSVLTMGWPTIFNYVVSGIFDAMSLVFMILTVYFTIEGTALLLDKRGEKSTANLGRGVWTCFVVLIVIALIATLLILIPGLTPVIMAILVVVDMVTSVVAYICYLVFLGKAKSRLA